MFSSALRTGHEVEALKHEAELVAPQAGERAVVEPRELDAVDGDRAGGRAVQAGEQVHERRLARARRPHDGREAALREVDGHVDEGMDGGVALAEGAAQVDGGDDERRRGHGVILARAPRSVRGSTPESTGSSPQSRAAPPAAAHRAAPTSAPMLAVIAIATAPQATTRTVARRRGAPPSRAPRPPSSPSASSVTTTVTAARAARRRHGDGQQRQRRTGRERQRRRPRGLERPGQPPLVEAQLVAGMRLQRAAA